MTEDSTRVRGIFMGDKAGPVVIHVNGAIIAVSAQGYVDAQSRMPQVGEQMPDGTVYAGISPRTRKPMFTTPADAPLSYQFGQATIYANKLDAHGHHDWRVPGIRELRQLFQLHAAIGGFNDDSYYWSSQMGHESGSAVGFKDGIQQEEYCHIPLSLRCVRG